MSSNSSQALPLFFPIFTPVTSPSSVITQLYFPKSAPQNPSNPTIKLILHIFQPMTSIALLWVFQNSITFCGCTLWQQTVSSPSHSQTLQCLICVTLRDDITIFATIGISFVVLLLKLLLDSLGGNLYSLSLLLPSCFLHFPLILFASTSVLSSFAVSPILQCLHSSTYSGLIKHALGSSIGHLFLPSTFGFFHQCFSNRMSTYSGHRESSEFLHCLIEKKPLKDPL